MQNTLLETRGLKKRYGNVTVLNDVSLEVRQGEIHALLGANGAGKSTLCKIVSGLMPATEGSMTLFGEDFQPRSKLDAESFGVEMVQQELNLVGSLSVAENLFLTRTPNRFGVINRRQLHRLARQVLDRFGLADLSSHVTVERLGVGTQQMVEIASALARDCKLLILDEPTAALSGGESEKLFEHLRDLRRRGVGIIYISHRLEEIKSLTDRITVLRDGRLVKTSATSELSTHDMVSLMSNEEPGGSSAIEFKSFRTEEVALRVRNVNSLVVNDVSFDVYRGQRFGISGLVGSGRTELLRVIFGADKATSGYVKVGAKSAEHRFMHPQHAVRAGLTLVTEDRKENGLLLSQSIVKNTTLCSLQTKFSSFGFLKSRDEKRKAKDLGEELELRCEGVGQTVGTLSGGNQQKVAIAKWLLCDGEVYLFDEPTRGIDVAARRRIYRLIETLVANGKACVIVSSDLEELMEICDTIAVMSGGRLVETFERGHWSHEKLTQASFAEYVS